MTNQQMIDYIKQQLQQGVNNEVIKTSLIANGWQSADVEEAFKLITTQSQLSQSDSAQQPKSFNKIILLVIIVIGVLVIIRGAIGYFVFIRNSPTPLTTQKTPGQISTQTTTQEQTTPKPTEKLEVSLNSWMKYTDPQNRFSFSYPPAFGTLSQGTNNGFGDRVAVIRFSEFSSRMQNEKIVLGGEVALTKDFILIDIQALGGLYDSITLEAFPDTLRNNIISNLPELTATNFCEELTKEQHVDLSKSVFASLSQQQKDAIISMDKTRNIDPKIIRCDVVGDTVTFHKEVTAEFGKFKSRQNIYGAIRFLTSPFSSFQIIRATVETPTQEMLSNITSVVKSFK